MGTDALYRSSQVMRVLAGEGLISKTMKLSKADLKVDNKARNKSTKTKIR